MVKPVSMLRSNRLPAWVAATAILAPCTGVVRAEQPAVSIPRIETPPAVDGLLDEPAWQQAAVLDGFHQYLPVDGRPAEERTEVRVFYTPTSLCFGITAHDSQPETLRATVGDRDNLDADDLVTLYLDTFDDRRRAFFFSVNALGAQEDGVHTEGFFSPGDPLGGQTDKNPDYLFESRGRVTGEGYVVELRIPFKSLRYPGGQAPQRWGLNVLRRVKRTGYVDTWTDVRRASASFLAQAGAIEGMRDLERGVVVEAQPFVTASADGLRDPARGAFRREGVDPSGDVNLRLGLSPDVSLDATVNPDFSQVESDVGQVTVNERFALFYPEKRPFFLEGIDLFSTPNQLVYTRQIADPLAGGKLTAKRGRLNVAHLTALDEAPEGRALFNTTRLRADFGSDSVAGLTFTQRSRGRDDNTVLAGDVRYVFGGIYYARGQLGGSWTRDAAGTRNAPLWRIEFDRTGHTWGFNYLLNGIGRGFESRAGFVPRNDVVELSAYNRLRYYGKRGALFEELTLFGGLNWLWRYDSFPDASRLEGLESADAILTIRGGGQVSARLERRFVNFDPADYNAYALPSGFPFRPEPLAGAWNGFVRLALPTYRRIDGHVQFLAGRVPIFAEASEGRETRVSSVLNLRAGASLRVGGSIVWSRLRRRHDGTEFARTLLPRLKLEYQPRRSLFFRVVGEYRAERTAALRGPADDLPLAVGGVPQPARRSNQLRVDALVSYEPTPGTVAFLGYGSTLESAERSGLSDLTRTADGFFVKLAYQFRR